MDHLKHNSAHSRNNERADKIKRQSFPCHHFGWESSRAEHYHVRRRGNREHERAACAHRRGHHQQGWFNVYCHGGGRQNRHHQGRGGGIAREFSEKSNRKTDDG